MYLIQRSEGSDHSNSTPYLSHKMKGKSNHHWQKCMMEGSAAALRWTDQ